MLQLYTTDAQLKVPSLSYHTMTLCKDTIYIYGGLTSKQVISGDLLFLNAFKSRCVNAKYDSNQSRFPMPRYCHSATYSKDNNAVMIFGGITELKERLTNELWLLKPLLKDSRFYKLGECNGKISRRCLHSAFIHKNKLFIYGGYGENYINKNEEYLNDMYSITLDSLTKHNNDNNNNEELYDTLKQEDFIVTYIKTVGNVDLKKKVVHVIKLNMQNEKDNYNNDVSYALFCNELSYFYHFTIQSDIEDDEKEKDNIAQFTKIEIKFLVPSPRDYYTINTSTNRIIILGGISSDTHKALNDSYTLHSFIYEGKTHYTWHSIDLYSQHNFKGINGHTGITLPNEHLLFFGGIDIGYDPLYYLKHYSIILKNHKPSNQFFLMNPYNIYRWLKPSDDREANQLRIPPRIQFTMTNYHNDEFEEVNNSHKIFILGGSEEQKVLCRAELYNHKKQSWEQLTISDIPQLKSHAFSIISHPNNKSNMYYLISGGITIEHVNQCKAKSNREKENCNCNNEIINPHYYLYSNKSFKKIQVISEGGIDISFPLERMGHNLVTSHDYKGDNEEIFLVNGFAVQIGFSLALMKLKVNINVANKQQEMYLTSEKIHLEDSKGLGRVNASACCYKRHLMIFGGIKDQTPLNDLIIIDLLTNTLIVYNIPMNYIYPRFGASYVLHSHLYTDQSTCLRLIIFGGSLWPGENMAYGITNEIIVFKMHYDTNNKLKVVDKLIPDAIGKGLQKVFHQSVLIENEIISFGGFDNSFISFSLPAINNKVCEYKGSLHDYVIKNYYVDPIDLVVLQHGKEKPIDNEERFFKKEEEKMFISDRLIDSLGSSSIDGSLPGAIEIISTKEKDISDIDCQENTFKEGSMLMSTTKIDMNNSAMNMLNMSPLARKAKMKSKDKRKSKDKQKQINEEIKTNSNSNSNKDAGDSCRIDLISNEKSQLKSNISDPKSNESNTKVKKWERKKISKESTNVNDSNQL